MEYQSFMIVAKTEEERNNLIQKLDEMGIRVLRVFDNLKRHIVVRMEWSSFQSVKSLPEVETLEMSKTYGQFNEQTITSNDNWGLDRIDQRSGLNGKYRYTRMGSTVDIYVIDTGIQLNHDDFNNRAFRVFDYRASIRIGSQTVYFKYNSDLDSIVSHINEVCGNVASRNGNRLKLDFGTATVVSTTNTSFSNILTVLGLVSGTYQSIVGTVDNPIINETTIAQYAWDDNGHGTHVAGIAAGFKYGVAKNARLYSVKCFESTGQSQTEYILEALDVTLGHHLAKNGARKSVANMSFGGPKSTAINTAVEEMVLNGITCCVAAGNSNVNAFTVSPASAGVPTLQNGPMVNRKPIVVAASTKSDTLAEFSNYDDSTTLSGNNATNYGSVVDIIAPGVGILSAYLSNTSTNATTTKSGTSMATPHVAGVCALHLDGDTLTPDELRSRLTNEATRDAITINNSRATEDRTPNLLLFQPYSETAFVWDESVGREDGTILIVDEGDPINVFVRAISSDNQGNRNPVLYSIPPAAPIAGTKQSIPSIGCEIECSTGRIVGQAPTINDDTSFPFTIRATDSLGRTIDKVFKIQVINVNRAPYWVTPEGTSWSYVEGDNVSVYVVADDPDENDTITYTLLNGDLPPGLVLSNGTGEIYGNIQNVNQGNRYYDFTIRATDESGESVDRSFKIYISETNQKPVWNQEWLPASQTFGTHSARVFGTFNIGDYVDIKTMAFDADYDALRFEVGAVSWPAPDAETISMNEIPMGLELNVSTGRITGVISPRNAPGKYFFKLNVYDGHNHYDNDGNLLNPPLTETFVIEVTDASSTIQEIPLVTYDPYENPQAFVRVPGGSRILTMTAQVLTPFTGINPRMKIGDKLDYERLMKEPDSNLKQVGTYITYPNFKYNYVGDMDLFITFDDDSSQPQYNVSLSNTTVTSITILNPGSGYRSAPVPDIRAGGGNGARAISFIKAVDVKIVNRGSGYIIGDVIRVVGGTAKTANALVNGQSFNMEQIIKISVTSVDENGAINSFRVIESGSYLIAPDNPVSTGPGQATTDTDNNLAWVGTAGSGATFNIDFGVKEVQVTNGGAGYLSPPTVVFGGNGITSGSLRILVEYIPSEVTVFFGNIQWVTPKGYLGEVYETMACPYSVKAIASGGFPVSYTLAPGSGPLPTGLSIDVTTGEIRGTCGFINQDTRFTFTIRASVGATFVDREFSLLMKNLFNTQPVTGVYMTMTGWDKIDWVKFSNQNIPEEYVFRPHDPEFGINKKPMMYLLFGLPDVTDMQLWTAMTGNPERPHEYDFYRRTDLYISELKTAVARDSKGNILYEVLYREVIDPLHRVYKRRGKNKIEVRAGGFNAGDSLVRSPVPYPQAASTYNVDDTRFIYPSSLTNMRKDLMAHDTGGIGLNGIEGLPLWMRSQQTLGDPKSVLGFVPAIELAYLKPGSAKAVLRHIRLGMDGWDDLLGTKLIFDRFFFLRYASTETTFDTDIFVPDPQQYPIVSTRNILDDSEVKIYSGNEFIDTPTTPGLYHYSNLDGNSITPDEFDLDGTKTLMQERAEDHAIARGLVILPGNPPRNPPYLTDTWNSDLVSAEHPISDFMPHENPNGVKTTFDNDVTQFDYQIYKTGKYFKFTPGDIVKKRGS